MIQDSTGTPINVVKQHNVQTQWKSQEEIDNNSLRNHIHQLEAYITSEIEKINHLLNQIQCQNETIRELTNKLNYQIQVNNNMNKAIDDKNNEIIVLNNKLINGNNILNNHLNDKEKIKQEFSNKERHLINKLQEKDSTISDLNREIFNLKDVNILLATEIENLKNNKDTTQAGKVQLDNWINSKISTNQTDNITSETKMNTSEKPIEMKDDIETKEQVKSEGSKPEKEKIDYERLYADSCSKLFDADKKTSSQFNLNSVLIISGVALILGVMLKK